MLVCLLTRIHKHKTSRWISQVSFRSFETELMG